MIINKWNWIKMHNINKIKKLKVLILKDKCLNKQNQNSNNNDYN